MIQEKTDQNKLVNTEHNWAKYSFMWYTSQLSREDFVFVRKTNKVRMVLENIWSPDMQEDAVMCSV